MAPHAFAGPGFYIQLKNDLDKADPADARIIAARARNCWLDGALWPPERAPVVSPGHSARIYSEKSNANGCLPDGRGARGIDIQLKEDGGDWKTPAGSPDQYKIVFKPDVRDSDFGFNFENNLTTWLPRADGHGLMCWDTDTRTSRRNQITATGYADINVLGDKKGCNRAVPATIKPDPKGYLTSKSPGAALGPIDVAHPMQPSGGPPLGTSLGAAGDAKAAPMSGGSCKDNDHCIVDLLSTVGVACSWYAYPGNTSYCNGLNPGDPTKWVLDNVPRKVKDFKVTGSIIRAQPKHSVGTDRLVIPATSGPGTLSVSKEHTRTTHTGTTTTHGANAGVEFGFEETSSIELPGIYEAGFKASQKVSAGYTWSNTTQKDTNQEDKITLGITAGAKPGYDTTLDVFTTKVDANYNYSGDLSFGKPGAVTPLVTPATQALNMSPATRHPCLGYVVGDATVRNSIMNIDKALRDAGNSEIEPTLAPERRAFLRGSQGFKAESKCPGFPAGFASVATFKGTGVGTYDNLGYDENANPRSAVIGCVYQTPLPAGARSSRTPSAPRQAKAGAADSPCQTIPGGKGKVSTDAPGNLNSGKAPAQTSSANVGTSGAGVLIPARGAETTDGTPISDKVLGDDGDERISTGSGTFDQVFADGGDDVVTGGLGEDLIHGGSGDDELNGGGGFDTVFGDEGRDRISDGGGAGSASGNEGDDTLIARGSDRLSMLGGPGEDRLESRGESTSSLGGGPGDDRYLLTGSGDANVFEMPGEGTDVLKTSRSLLVPPEIEKTVATGGRQLELRSRYGRQTLVGNRAANVLNAGKGSDRVRGRRGDDEILLNEFGFDRVTGGEGADRFVPLGTPANANRGAAIEDPTHRTAHLITDFHPGGGDRLVMRGSVFGKGLFDQRRKLVIVQDRNPRPRNHRATVLFDDRTGLVRFDRDGTGPISDKVAVVLPDANTLKRSWLRIHR